MKKYLTLYSKELRGCFVAIIPCTAHQIGTNYQLQSQYKPTHSRFRKVTLPHLGIPHFSWHPWPCCMFSHDHSARRPEFSRHQIWMLAMIEKATNGGDRTSVLAFLSDSGLNALYWKLFQWIGHLNLARFFPSGPLDTQIAVKRPPR